MYDPFIKGTHVSLHCVILEMGGNEVRDAR